MKLIKNLNAVEPLRTILQRVISDNDIPESSLAEMLDIDRRTFEAYLNEGKDLKFTQALAIMKFLGMEEREFIESYEKDLEEDINENKVEQAERLAYILNNFDVNTLKKIGVLKKRCKIEDYEKQLIDFFGFHSSIYEYNSFAPIVTLYSKSKVSIEATKRAKMDEFWIRCSRYSFEKINNPYEYDEELLSLFLKKIHEYTCDTVHGYEKVVMTLFRMGVTVLTQPYLQGVGSFGASMFVNGKPCIIVTDMMKKYHKLWLTLLHELYHIIMDRQMLERTVYHISSQDDMTLFFNEGKADEFARNLLVPTNISGHMSNIMVSPYRVKKLADGLSLHPSIVYGVYLEGLSSDIQKREFPKYASQLIGSDTATRPIVFNPAQSGNLNVAIDEIKEKLYNIKIA